MTLILYLTEGTQLNRKFSHKFHLKSTYDAWVKVRKCIARFDCTCLCPTMTSRVAGCTFGAGNFSWMYPQWLCARASLSRHAVQFSMLRMQRTLCSRCSSFSRNSNNEVPFKLCPLSTTLRLDNLKQTIIKLDVPHFSQTKVGHSYKTLLIIGLTFAYWRFWQYKLYYIFF